MWRDTVNQVLRGTVGYELRKATSEAPGASAGVPAKGAAVSGGGEAPAGKTGAGKTGAGKGAGNGAGKKQGPPVPGHVDDAATVILERVRPRTMTSWAKLYGLVLAVRYVVRYDVPGEIVECGVWRGGSMQAAALTLTELGAERHLHLFDTFEGMPPPGEHDKRHDGVTAEHLLDTRDRGTAVWAIAGLEDVQAGMAEVGWPEHLVSYHPGMVEETVPSQAPEVISILRLDTDWYESTKHELDHLYDRLSPGGVLIIDDYAHWQGSSRATEEFLDRTGAQLLTLPLGTGRIAVKPMR